MTVKDLKEKLDKYDESLKVEIVIWGCSDCPTAELRVGEDEIMSAEY